MPVYYILDFFTNIRLKFDVKIVGYGSVDLVIFSSICYLQLCDVEMSIEFNMVFFLWCYFFIHFQLNRLFGHSFILLAFLRLIQCSRCFINFLILYNLIWCLFVFSSALSGTMTSKSSKRVNDGSDKEEDDDDYVPYIPVKQRRRMELETAAKRMGRAEALKLVESQLENGKNSSTEDDDIEAEPAVGPNSKIRCVNDIYSDLSAPLYRRLLTSRNR